MSPNPEDPIDYRYLNIDTQIFVKSLAVLTKQIGVSGEVRAIPNYNHSQVVVAASKNHFTETAAIILCRRLSGVKRGQT